jgi:MFS family permease
MFTASTLRDIWLLLLSYFFGVLPYMLLPPLTTIILAERGLEPSLIGVYGASNFVALMVSSLFASRLANILGQRRAYLGATVISLVVISSYLLTDSLALWFIFSIITGLTGAIRWIVGESWVAALSPPESRGRFIGMFETMIGACTFAGPAILLLTGTTTQLPFAIAAVCALIGLFLLLPIRAPKDAHDDEATTTASPKRFGILQAIPVVLLAAFVGGMFEAGTTTILPVFAVATGLGALFATSVVTAIGVGSFALQYPFGHFADRFPLQKVLLIGMVIMLAASLTLPLAQRGWLLWLLGFIFGGVGGGLYTLAMIQIGHQFSGLRLVQATSLLVFTYNLGSALGPGLGGVALQLSPRFGLAALFSPVALLAIIFMLLIKDRNVQNYTGTGVVTK